MPEHDRSGDAPRSAAPRLLDPARLSAVRRVLAAGPGNAHLDRITRLASELLHTPFAQLSLLAEEQYVWSLHGAPSCPTSATPACDSLCRVTVEGGGPLSVSDALHDARVAGLPPVTTGGVQAYLGVPLVGQDGHVLGALCVYDTAPRDWTPGALGLLAELAQSVVVELELRALTVEASTAAARLELALDAADIGSFDLDGDTGRLLWDERLIRLFGYDVETFVEHLDSFNDRVHPDDRERMAEVVDHAIANKGELSAEYRIVRPTGEVRWVEARGRVLVLQGSPHLLGVAYDSTELRTARDRLSRLLETMTDAFYSLDRDWRFTYVNRQAERLLERRRDELLGRSLWEEFPETLDSPFERHYRHSVEHDEPVAFEAPYAPLGGWYELSAWPGPDGLSVYFREITQRRDAEQERERAYVEREQAVVERERAYAEAEAANQRLRLLADASTRLAASLLPSQVLETLTDLVVPELGKAVVVALTGEVASAYLGRETSSDPTALHVVHVAHAAADQTPLLRALVDRLSLSARDPVGVGAVVRRRRPEWLPEVPDEVLRALAPDDAALEEMRQLAVRSALSLPLVTGGRVLGALTVNEPAASQAARDLLEEYAGRAAVALDNALLYAEQQRTAETLQRSLLPRALPAVPGVRTAARYLPGATGARVGGDWYQGVRVGDQLVLAMGDVMGHGMRSAARMGQLRAIVATLALEGHGPGLLLTRLADNSDALLDLDLATLLVAVLDPADGTLTVASAGHPPPLLAPSTGEPAYLEVAPGPPLGTLPGTYAEVTTRLEPGATLVLYTDGLVEQRGEEVGRGLERLRDALRGLRLSPEDTARHVLRAVGREGGGADDVALLVLARDPAPA